MVRRARLADTKSEATVIEHGYRLGCVRRLPASCKGTAILRSQDRSFRRGRLQLRADGGRTLPDVGGISAGWHAPLTATGSTIPEDANIDDLLHRFRWLAGRVTADRWFAATVLPQLHVLAWGDKRGV